MRLRKALLSTAAGLFTPFAVLTLLNGLQAASAGAGSPPLEWKVALIASTLFALGVALCPPIEPLYFGVAFIPAVPLWYAVLSGSARSSNLFGLALILFTIGGVIAAVIAGLGATLARHWRLPAWAPIGPLFLGAALIVFARIDNTRAAADDAQKIAALLQRIATTEKDYVAAHPGVGYTCDAPVADVRWRANTGLGGIERNEAQVGQYWLHLTCEPAAHPTWFTITARGLWAGGPVLNYDSRKATR
jgi:hypothetical protein